MSKYNKLGKHPRVRNPVGTFFLIEDDINMTFHLQQHKAVCNVSAPFTLFTYLIHPLSCRYPIVQLVHVPYCLFTR